MVAPYASEELNCGQVQAGVVKCLPYLHNRDPMGQYCNGIDMSKTVGLRALCGVKSPFKISLSTDCTKVQ
ncbi:hypothetical protein RDI58_025006 [Solanum bulbocastanum]|uniref:Non-specific lipid-transfer protein n=1 Tax=Solanum bulbocastanum TaxID=147425 RepID=A0AAN8Y665_SOLBU